MIGTSSRLTGWNPTIKEFRDYITPINDDYILEFAIVEEDVFMRVRQNLTDDQIKAINIKRLEKELETLKNNK